MSSSGGEENHSPPRATLLLGHNGESLAGKPSEETSNSCKESGEIEASELTPATSSKMKEKEKEEEGEEGDTGEKIMHEGKNEEEESEIQEKKTDEEEKEIEINGKNMDLEGNSEEEEEVKKEEKEKNVKENESEAQKDDRVQDGVCDEREERENLENERRDEMGESKPKLENVENTVQVETLEITPRMEEEIRTEKTADEREAKEEENRQGNNEQRAASSSDSPKDEEEEGMKNEEEVETAVKQKNVNEDKKDKEKQEDEAKNKRGEEEVEDAETEKKDKREEHKREEEKEEEEEGVDPFRSKTTKDSSSSRRGTKIKTVNFLDSELKKQFENNLAKRNTLNSTSSFSSSSSKSKEEEDEEELVRLEGKAEEKSVRQWSLEGNPVYRLSLKLSPNLFNTTDIPGANQHKEVEKTGFLTKLSGRSFPYIAQWKRRYCVLSKGRLYYYEREDSKEGDKANGVIQLEYFDQVAEAGPKECKKATNVFIITSQDRSFFDPGRHLFSADTLPEMKDWIRRLQAALDQIRNNNRPAASTSPSAPPSAKDGGGKRRREEAAESKDGAKGSQQQNGNKDRKKKKEESGRGRKSSRGGVSSQTQTSMVEPTTSEVDGGRPSTITPKGGVMLPGFSSRKDPQAMGKPAQRRSGDGEAEEDLPQAGPTLQCVTKMRVKGPQGRRVPQNRRMAAAAALKKRASSLSALEHQDAADNRSEGSEGATRSSRESRTPEGDLKAETESEEENERKKLKIEPLDEEQEIHGHSPERQFKIDNIDDGLFFKAGLKDGGTMGGSEWEGQKNRRSVGLKVNFEESPASPAKNGTLGKIFRFRETLPSTKRKNYKTKDAVVADHPDMMNNSRWTCVVL